MQINMMEQLRILTEIREYEQKLPTNIRRKRWASGTASSDTSLKPVTVPLLWLLDI
jgi:hypothetical protein